MEQAKATMGNKVALTRTRNEELYNDSNWKELIYHTKDVNLDVVSIIYAPINSEGEEDLEKYVLPYIEKHFGSNIVYFYVNKDIDGIKGLIYEDINTEESNILE
jgi:hypothetical protein